MARPLRIEFENAFYHVFNRGLEKREIFKSKADYEAFLKILTLLQVRFAVKIHSYCLMPNHYHLFVETPKPNLSRFMRELNGSYTQSFNRSYNRVGPLFQGRFKAILVDQDNYALELSRYIHLNPVKAKISELAQDYPWSSYAFFVGNKKKPEFLGTDFILSQFKDLKAFKQFTHEGLAKQWDPLKSCEGGSLLGSKEFIELVKEKFLPKEKNSSIANLKALQKPNDLTSIKQKVSSMASGDTHRRKLLVHALKTYTSLSLKEIALQLGDNLSEPAISQINRRFVEEDKARGYRDVNRLKVLLNVKT